MKTSRLLISTLLGFAASTMVGQREAHATPYFVGSFQGVSNGDTAYGFACQPWSPNPVTVQVYAGNPAQGGVLIADGVASQPSDPAIAAFCNSTSNSLRFQITIPAEARSLYAGSLLYMTAGGASSLLSTPGPLRLPGGKGGDWTFDDGAGSVATGAGDSGTLVNGPTWTSADQCHAGPCLSFANRASQTSVNVPYTDALRFGTGDFTVSAWVKTTDPSGGRAVVGANRCNTWESWSLGMTDGKPSFWAMGPGVFANLTSEVAVADGAWHLLVARRQGTSLSLVVDGGLVGSAVIPASYNSDSGTSTLRIGNQEGCSMNGFVGSIDDVHIVARALTDGELGISRPAHLSAINLRSLANDRLVSGKNGTAPLIAAATVADEWESFLFEDLGGGVVALRSSNQKYLQAQNAGASPLVAANPTIGGTWEKYQWIDLGEQKFALRSLANNRYVCAEGGGSGSLIANRTAIGPWETFQWEKAPVPIQLKGKTLAFRATAGAGGFASTIGSYVDRDLFRDQSLSTATKFQVVDLGGGRVALKAMGTNLYVSAQATNSNHPLAPNAVEVGPWETFEWVYLGGPQALNNQRFALRSLGNNLFVKAGTMFLNFEAVSPTIGPNETFEWQVQSDGSDSVAGGGFSFVYDKVYGNKDFGLNLWIVAAATNKTSLDTLLGKVAKSSAPGRALDRLLPDASGQVSDPAFAEVLGDAGVSATLFGFNSTILEVGGYARNDLANTLAVTAQGSTVYSGSLGLGSSLSISKTFLTYSQQFMVGPVPLTITADMTGTVGVSSTLALSSQLVSTTTPGLDLSVHVAGGVGTSMLSAGVESSLNLLDASMPLGLTYTPAGRTYNVSSKLDLSAMQGSISLYAQAKINLGFYKVKKKYSKKIAGWDGISLANQTLLNTTGSL